MVFRRASRPNRKFHVASEHFGTYGPLSLTAISSQYVEYTTWCHTHNKKLEILNLKHSLLFLPLMSSATRSRHLEPSNLLDPTTTLLHNPLHETEPNIEPEPEPESKPLTFEPKTLTFERTLRTPEPMDLLTMNPVPAPMKPVWNPKDKNTPLKEDYVQFYQDTL
jgi:hypothetical protein